MLTHTADEPVAIKGAFQIVPKSLAASSIARKKNEELGLGKWTRKKKEKETLNLYLGESSLRILIDSIKSAES